MTDEQYNRACQIKSMIMTLQGASGLVSRAKSIEIHCGNTSEDYCCEQHFGKSFDTQVFKIMQESIIMGLQNKIVELEEEYKNL